jgi:hypothetical protein
MQATVPTKYKEIDDPMKKLLSMMIGLGLVLMTSTLTFAADDKKEDKKEGKKKGKKKKKDADTK